MMGTITRIGSVTFSGDIRKPKNVSAVVTSGDWMLLASDETNRVQLLRRSGEGYVLSHDVVLDLAVKEIDIEGITREGDTI
jgi:hypothetical protein